MKISIIYLLILCIPNLALSSSPIKPDYPLPTGAFFNTHEPQKIQLLSSGTASLEKRLQMIESAQNSIDLEVYIYSVDFSSRMISQALLRKAKEGVKVRVLIDGTPTLGLSPSMNAHFGTSMIKAGVEMHNYNPLSSSDSIQHRNHRKMLLVDGNKAIVGGRNIQDIYYELSDTYNFFDRDIYVEGTIVNAMAESFNYFWKYQQAKNQLKPLLPSRIQDFGFQSEDQAKELSLHDSSARSSYQRFQESRQKFEQIMKTEKDFISSTQEDRIKLQQIREMGASELETEFQSTCLDSYFIADLPGPEIQARILAPHLKKFLQASQKEVWIETPYIVLPKSNDLFSSVFQAGIPLVVHTNSLYTSDNPMAVGSLYSRVSALQGRGVQVYLSNGKSIKSRYIPFLKNSLARWGIHSKSLVIDSETTVITSFNIDPRSKDLNAELAFICKDHRELATFLKEDMLVRQKEMVQLDKNGENKFFKSTWKQKTMYYILKPIGQLLEEKL